MLQCPHPASSAFGQQNAQKRGQAGLSVRGFVLACVVAAVLVCAPGFWPAPGSGATAGMAWAKSAYSAPNTGIEAPGGPKPMEGLPGRNVSRTSEGGMGYTDAYGNTITENAPEEKAAKRRPGPGAYGNRGAQEHNRPLPDPTPKDTAPVWNFN
ncbi:MAG: translation initiation factor IF-2 [Desulfovibrio sp.]|nr:translation initiation factor IF-2 [Desulfovibrio sp.]